MSTARRSDEGFTLLEILVVLVIMALIAAQVAPGLAGIASLSERRVAGAIGRALERARETAIRQATPIALDPRSFANRLPEGFELIGPRLVFFPEGGSSGGQWVLADENGALRRYRVDWLSGQVTTDTSDFL